MPGPGRIVAGRPFRWWHGSKAVTGLCQAIVAAMPPHSGCIESHLGGGAIMKRKPPAQRSIDLNRRATDGFRRDHDVELVLGCWSTYFA